MGSDRAVAAVSEEIQDAVVAQDLKLLANLLPGVPVIGMQPPTRTFEPTQPMRSFTFIQPRSNALYPERVAIRNATQAKNRCRLR